LLNVGAAQLFGGMKRAPIRLPRRWHNHTTCDRQDQCDASPEPPSR